MNWTPEMDSRISALYATHTRVQIAAQMGLRESQVRARFWALGMATKIRPWSASDLEAMRAEYAKPYPSIKDLAARLGRDPGNISRKAGHLGLTNQKRLKKPPEEKARQRKYSTDTERKEAQSLHMKKWIAENGHPRGATGLKHSEELKQASRDRIVKMWAGMTESQKGDMVIKAIRTKRESGKPIPNARGTWKAGWRNIGGEPKFYRSRWEANYARFLQWLKDRGEIAGWEHEPKTFWFDGIKRGVVSYKPDFRVAELNGSHCWHEVKGWMDDRSRTALARMSRYHPNEKVVLVDQKWFKSAKAAGIDKLLPGWEREEKAKRGHHGVRIEIT